jgi:hypothetical protein
MKAVGPRYHEPEFRTLDFIVFGVARSGTGALARALNFHPHVYVLESASISATITH